LAPVPAQLVTAALEVPRCQCPQPLGDSATGECVACGREIRPLGTVGRAWRQAAYDRQLRWARGEGLDPLYGFKGLAQDVGPNPAVKLLRDALEARVAG